MAAHVDLQGAGTGAALLALGKGADALVGVGILGLFVQGGRGSVLAAGTVVHQMSLQVPLTPVPDATILAGKDVLWKAEENQRRRKTASSADGEPSKDVDLGQESDRSNLR